jgi:cysteinyl-tRNA synthetase
VLAAREEFLDALADDFNTARAMAALFALIADAHRDPLAGAHDAVAELLDLVGLASLADVDAAADPEAEALLADREAARANRDFERADALRAELTARGYEIRDTPSGPRLVRRG